MSELLRLVVLIFFVLINSNSSLADQDNIVCRDENNDPVDWFYLYKLPKNKFRKNDIIQEGLGYMFITPKTIGKGWALSTKSINDTGSIPGFTLSPLYRNDNNIVKLIYNDQPEVENDTKDSKPTPTTSKPKRKPKKKRRVKNNSGDGHTKGVVLGNGKEGIWLIHSVPKYPPIPDESNSVKDVKYSYPKSGTVFGQSFLCISLYLSEMQNVGQQLKFNEPKITYHNFPKSFQSTYSNLLEVINNKTVTSAPWYNIEKITSKSGNNFISFAKSANFEDDLYESLVGPSLKKNLLVETWINGRGVLTSNCTNKFSVNNIEKVAFMNESLAFSSHSDHSKWAISNGPDDHGNIWVCIGDINRAKSQESRGGGTVCTQNSDLWKNYDSIVNVVDPCPLPSALPIVCNN